MSLALKAHDARDRFCVSLYKAGRVATSLASGHGICLLEQEKEIVQSTLEWFVSPPSHRLVSSR